MRSIKFPKMFSTNSTDVWLETEYKAATSQNLKLALLSMRGELLGDPYFGMLLQKYLFEQNNYLTRDLLVDMIYTNIALFIPQLRVRRSDISIIPSKKLGQLICKIHGVNQIDYTPNTYELVLFSDNAI